MNANPSRRPRFQPENSEMSAQAEKRRSGKSGGVVAAMVQIMALALCGVLSSCMVAGEREIDPTTGANRTSFIAMAGTDAGSMPMPYRDADGKLAVAKKVNQSKATATVVTGVVSGMAVKAYEAVQTGAQGVDRALSKDSTNAAINADNNATDLAKEKAKLEFAEAELSAGQ